MKYTEAQRESISAEAKGKVIEKLEYEEKDNYWVMTFSDGSEISFRFMAELVGRQYQ
jgi:hypothetical protein